jgi:hypothetical protein
MRHSRNRPTQLICGRGGEKRRCAGGKGNPSGGGSNQLLGPLMHMLCFQERGVKKIRKPTHEGITKAVKMNSIVHFFGEISTGLILPATCLTKMVLSCIHLQTEFSRKI